MYNNTYIPVTVLDAGLRRLPFLGALAYFDNPSVLTLEVVDRLFVVSVAVFVVVRSLVNQK